MTEKNEFDLDIKVDPELHDDDEHGGGGEEHYDNKAVETVPFDATLFELPDDFVVEEEEGEDEEDD